jgi:hypothetical protein
MHKFGVESPNPFTDPKGYQKAHGGVSDYEKATSSTALNPMGTPEERKRYIAAEKGKYDAALAYWKSRGYTGIPDLGDSPFGWIEDAIKVAGRSLEFIAKTAADGIDIVGDLTGKIPIVGPAFTAALHIASGPLHATQALLDGERIDRIAIAQFKDTLANIRTIAPLAKTIVSFVPGLGTGIAAGIAAAEALATGASITDALTASIKAALPGGPLAAAAFELTQRAIAGQRLDQAVLDTGVSAVANQLPYAAKLALETVAAAIRDGQRLDKAALKTLRENVPEYAQHAIDIGVAIGQGRNLQTVIKVELNNIGPDVLNALSEVGDNLAARYPAIAKAKEIAGSHDAQLGFKIGVGLMQHRDISEDILAGVREKLDPAQREAFDIGVSTYKGMVVSKQLTGPADTKAAYYITVGMQRSLPAMRKVIMSKVVLSNNARIGVQMAERQIAHDRAWWRLVLRAIGIYVP